MPLRFEAAEPSDTGVVDENVEASRPPRRLVDERLHRKLIANVGRKAQHSRAAGRDAAELGFCLLEVFLFQAADRDMRALLNDGRGNDEVDGGAGDADQAIGDLGDDKVLGGAGAGDEAAGDLGIDIVNGGPGKEDLVHGDYGWDRMSGGAGKGDIASFATDVAAANGAGVWVSLSKHRAYGDGHDKLFGFESIEGSAFRDTLIGNKQGNTIDGGPGDDQLLGGGGPDRLDGGQGGDGCKGAKGGTVSCGKERAPQASAYVQLDPTPAAAPASRSSAAAAATSSSSPSTR